MLTPQGSVSGQESLAFLSDYWAVVQSMHSIHQERLERMCHKMEADTWITVQWRLPDGS